jgi:hypothetical protein
MSDVVHISKLKKDGSYEVASGNSINSQKMLFFQKSLYKAVYKGQNAKGHNVVAFLARGVKSYDNMLLVHVTNESDPAGAPPRLLSFHAPPDPSPAPKTLHLNKGHTSQQTLQAALPDVKQVLLTPDSLIMLERATSIHSHFSSV